MITLTKRDLYNIINLIKENGNNLDPIENDIISILSNNSNKDHPLHNFVNYFGNDSLKELHKIANRYNNLKGGRRYSSYSRSPSSTYSRSPSFDEVLRQKKSELRPISKPIPTPSQLPPKPITSSQQLSQPIPTPPQLSTKPISSSQPLSQPSPKSPEQSDSEGKEKNKVQDIVLSKGKQLGITATTAALTGKTVPSDSMTQVIAGELGKGTRDGAIKLVTIVQQQHEQKQINDRIRQEEERVAFIKNILRRGIHEDKENRLYIEVELNELKDFCKKANKILKRNPNIMTEIYSKYISQSRYQSGGGIVNRMLMFLGFRDILDMKDKFFIEAQKELMIFQGNLIYLKIPIAGIRFICEKWVSIFNKDDRPVHEIIKEVRTEDLTEELENIQEGGFMLDSLPDILPSSEFSDGKNI